MTLNLFREFVACCVLVVTMVSCGGAGRPKDVVLECTQALPGVCMEVPSSFKRVLGCGVQPVESYAEFQLWGWRYPEFVSLAVVSDREFERKMVLASIARHGDASAVGRIPGLTAKPWGLHVYDRYAEVNVTMFFAHLKIGGRELLYTAYCLPMRGYCDDLRKIPSRIHTCPPQSPTPTDLSALSRPKGTADR